MIATPERKAAPTGQGSTRQNEQHTHGIALAEHMALVQAAALLHDHGAARLARLLRRHAERLWREVQP